MYNLSLLWSAAAVERFMSRKYITEEMIRIIEKPEDLVTSREQTRAGFIAFALEKNRRSTPIIESAKSFIAAAIEKKMATEIFAQLQNKTLSNAANLTVDMQLVNYCNWLLKL